MTAETEQLVTSREADLKTLGKHLVLTSETIGERAAAQALAEEESILTRANVRAALIVDGPHGATARWEGLSGRQYTLGLDETQRRFLDLVLSVVGIGHVTIAAVRGLDERRLRIIMRAILRLAENDTLAVGTRI
ncbi:hypothetical protein ABZ027_08315 [Streptomyces sp. NPDC006332]|uniref:hypothetical protein n=1 Tax=Streptomyces sp. NPDC006332 TaxID=3155456 RepID=UPI0033BC1920